MQVVEPMATVGVGRTSFEGVAIWKAPIRGGSNSCILLATLAVDNDGAQEMMIHVEFNGNGDCWRSGGITVEWMTCVLWCLGSCSPPEFRRCSSPILGTRLYDRMRSTASSLGLRTETVGERSFGCSQERIDEFEEDGRPSRGGGGMEGRSSGRTVAPTRGICIVLDGVECAGPREWVQEHMPCLSTPARRVSYHGLLLVSMFGGIFGVDRLIVGDVGLGLAKLFTVGGYGIWWVTDMILVALGKVVPEEHNVPGMFMDSHQRPHGW